MVKLKVGIQLRGCLHLETKGRSPKKWSVMIGGNKWYPIFGYTPRNKVVTTRTVVCLDSSFSMAGFALKAPHERNSLERHDELLALLALFYKSRTTKECPLEIHES
jgi:hypothetical protein